MLMFSSGNNNTNSDVITVSDDDERGHYASEVTVIDDNVDNLSDVAVRDGDNVDLCSQL
jgi:hypothetical protein